MAPRARDIACLFACLFTCLFACLVGLGTYPPRKWKPCWGVEGSWKTSFHQKFGSSGLHVCGREGTRTIKEAADLPQAQQNTAKAHHEETTRGTDHVECKGQRGYQLEALRLMRFLLEFSGELRKRDCAWQSNGDLAKKELEYLHEHRHANVDPK